MNKHKTILTVAAALAAAFLLFAGLGGVDLFNERKAVNFDRSPHTVDKAIDGDTIRLKDGTKVRLIGIDSPAPGECYGPESTEFLADLIEGKAVRLEKDISGEDIFGRLLRYIIIPSGDPAADDTLVNDLLVRQGQAFAVSFPPDSRYRDLFASAQQEAQRANRGLWGACDYEQAPGQSARREQDSPPPNPSCIIKGNISEAGFGRIYLLPGCDNYDRVKIDLRKGEQYFCSEAEAQAADYRKATNCPS